MFCSYENKSRSVKAGSACRVPEGMYQRKFSKTSPKEINLLLQSSRRGTRGVLGCLAVTVTSPCICLPLELIVTEGDGLPRIGRKWQYISVNQTEERQARDLAEEGSW